jgi:hypothetical protein
VSASPFELSRVHALYTSASPLRWSHQAADRFFILPTGHSTTGLDAVVEVTGNKVKMTYPIEDLVFDEK